jgi:uncharacterized protein
MNHIYTVAVLGASPKPQRYSHQAVQLLGEYGHRVLPINPLSSTICGYLCYKKIEDIDIPVHTLTLYVGADISTRIQDSILALHPQRIIMNPGAENDTLEGLAQAQGIEVVRGCTLVMLKTGQF